MKQRKYRIAVISDTHGLLRPQVQEILQTCDAILHAGDIDRPEILAELKETAKTYAVRGNADRDLPEDLPEDLEVCVAGIHFYIVHNKKYMKKNLDGIDVVICGHSHKYEEKREDGKLFLNPGSCGPRRFRLPVTMAVIEADPEHKDYKTERIDLNVSASGNTAAKMNEKDLQDLIVSVIREMNGGRTVEQIAKKHGADRKLVEQICRIYVTHPGVTAEGILNKMEANTTVRA